MAESVQDLVVRLSFEHGDTKNQISAIRNEIKLLDSGFQAAAVQAGGFSDSLNEAQARAQLLQQKISLQQTMMQKYAQAIEQANEKLQAAQGRYADYGSKLDAAKQKQAELNDELANVRQAMEASANATGKNTEEYAQLAQREAELEQALSDCGREIQQWERSLTRADSQINSADRNIQNLQIAQNQAAQAAGEYQQQLDSLNDTLNSTNPALAQLNENLNGGDSDPGAKWKAAGTTLNDYAESAKKAGEAQEDLGEKLSIGSAAIVGAGTAAVGAAVKWESSCADMEKTISGTAEQLQTIEDGMIEMSKVKPIDPETLAQIAANAGQLGIATENVLGFTDVMSDLANTTDLSAESAASSFAQFANVTGMAQENFDRLGSVVVELGNNTATTESAIVDMGTNLASAGAQIGLTESEIMGVAAALSSLGLEAQAGGTAFSKLFVDMQVAVETGSDKLAQYAEVAGMSAEKFASAFRDDAAGAIAQFIEGLSSGSQSAIVMLDEMGISETRMRDALLRASNASELFTGTISMANSAWSENTALANEASVRYGTTESKLATLGNKVKATAISFGEELVPALNKGVDFIGELVDKFSALDEGAKKNILTFGAFAAAIGPAVTGIGKLNGVIASVSSGIGNFVSAIGNAGGGLSGLMSAIGGLLGPAGIAALAGGAVAAGVAFVDWASGAKEAREATAGLVEIAKQLNEVQAQTIYDTGTTDPLARFGLSKESFTGAEKETGDWLGDLMQVWTDGEKESDEIVSQFVDSFVEGSDSVREKIQSQGALLEGLNVLNPEAKAKMEADMTQLDSYDQEIETLLKKRQNGYITKDEEARLGEVIKLRGELELEYTTPDESGYDKIISGMQSEIDRFQASTEGGVIDPSLFGDTLNALAEGRQAYTQALNENYDAQHQQIMGIEDEATRTAALEALNAQYNAQRLQGEQEYRSAVQEAATAAMEGVDYSDQIAQIDQLAQLVQSGDLDASAALDWANNLDEGKLASMLALIEQLKASGTTDSQFAEMGIDVDDLYSKLQQVQQATSTLATTTTGEAQEGFQALSDIIGGAVPDEVQRILMGLDMTQAAADWAAFEEGKNPWTVDGSMTISSVDETAIETWKTAHTDTPITGPAVKLGVLLGDDWASTVQTQIDSGLVSVYGEDGAKLPITPDVSQLSANDIVMLGEDGTLHIIVTPDVSPTASAEVPVNIKLSPIDQAAITAWETANSGVTLNGPAAKVGVKLGADWKTDITTALNNGLLTVTDINGVEVPVNPKAPEEKITANDLVAVDEDGNIYVTIMPKMGTTEAVDAAQGLMENDNSPLPDWMTTNTAKTVSSIDSYITEIDRLNAKIAEMDANNEVYDENGVSMADYQQQVQGMTQTLGQLYQDLHPEDMDAMSASIATMMAALADPNLDPATAAEYAAQLQQMLTVIQGADQYSSTGEDVSAGIAQGMAAYDWSGDGAALQAAMLAAINGALGVASPATTMVPTGGFVAAGIAQGMTEFNFGAASNTIASQIVGAFSGLPSKGKSIGSNFGSALKSGLSSQLSGAVALARSYANQITQAFQNAWQIHSPSKVAMNLTKMFGKGLELGEREWPTVSEDLLNRDMDRLHSGFTTVSNSIDNRRSYDNRSSVNLNVDSLQVNDEQDIHTLASEIAGLGRRRAYGYGK